MRFLSLIVVLMLCACATPPGERSTRFAGVYAPAVAKIAEDGSFEVRASVWHESDQAIAAAAARHQLLMAAQKGGYDRFRLIDASVSNVFGYRVLITGQLYRPGEGPREALPLSLIEVSEPDFGAAVAEPAPVVRKKHRAPARRTASVAPPPAEAEPAVMEPASEPVPEEPVVIKAPEFISSVPGKRPVG